MFSSIDHILFNLINPSLIFVILFATIFIGLFFVRSLALSFLIIIASIIISFIYSTVITEILSDRICSYFGGKEECSFVQLYKERQSFAKIVFKNEKKYKEFYLKSSSGDLSSKEKNEDLIIEFKVEYNFNFFERNDFLDKLEKNYQKYKNLQKGDKNVDS